MLESVLEIGKELCLVEELGGLKLGQACAQLVLGKLGDSLQECERHILADDCGRLQQSLVLGRQPVDARRQDRLSGRRDLQIVRRLRQAIGAALAGQRFGLYQRPDALLEEEGVAVGARDQQVLERLKAGVVPEQGIKQLFGALGWQRDRC